MLGKRVGQVSKENPRFIDLREDAISSIIKIFIGYSFDIHVISAIITILNERE